ITELDTDLYQSGAFLTPDCNTVYFTRGVPPITGIFVSNRAAVDQPWEPAVLLDMFTEPATLNKDPWMSPDRRTFVFASDRANPGSKRLDINIPTRCRLIRFRRRGRPLTPSPTSACRSRACPDT